MNPSPAPDFALLSAVDITAFSGSLFTRANPLSATSFTNKIYEDMITFLNGRGMNTGLDLSAQLLTSSNFGTNWHIGINANDKIEVSSTHAFRIKYNSSSSLDGVTDVLGIGNSFVLYVGSATIGSPLLSFAATAPNEWLRGEIVSFSYIIEEIGGGGASFTWNFSGGAQDLIVACRARGNADIDDSIECLEAEDLAIHAGTDIRWMLDNNGHVKCSYASALNITWNNDEFRNRLGFKGNETIETVNLYSVITASHPCPGVLKPTRPYQSSHISIKNISQARRKISGGYTANYVGTYIITNLIYDLDARLDTVDLYRHFTNKFINFISEGERINFYQVWGDSRRALITEDVNTDQVAHDLIYTSSRNGYEGRIRASLITKDYDLIYPLSLRRRVPVKMKLEHL